MRKYRSKSERDYKEFFRHLRVQGGSWSNEEFPLGITDEQDCAVLSYDNQQTSFSGWINPDRKHKWFIVTQAKTFREDWFRK